MELEDVFYIYILEDVLKYKVIDIKVVLPDDTENIKPIKEKSLVTLVTCTPKYVNSHRILVIGERVENDEHINKVDEGNYIVTKVQEYQFFTIVTVTVLTAVIVLSVIFSKRMCRR